MLIQKIDRHPTEVTSTPPTTGPKAMDTPTTAAQTPTAWARSRGMVKVLVMIDMATGLSIDPPTAWTMRKTMSSVEVGCQAAEQRARGEGHQPDDEGAPTPEAVGGRAGEHEQAGQHQRVGVHRPLQPRQRGVEVVADGGQGDVDDGDVDAHDEQAHGADEQDADAPPPAQLVHHGQAREQSLPYS